MLKLKHNVNVEELTALGFAKFKVNREQTNYYFAVRRGWHAVIVDSRSRMVAIDNITPGDNRLHANIKWQNKEATVEDGIYLLTDAGMVERE